MDDLMLLGVLRMPMPANPDPLTLLQFVERARRAADEIERLTAELDSLSLAYKTSEDDVFNLTQKVIPNLRAERDALQANLDVEEPVAWMFDRATWHEGDIRGRGWRPDISRIKPYDSGMVRNVVPLYAAPPDFDDLQIKYDDLMMEFCSYALTDEQRARWVKRCVKR